MSQPLKREDYLDDRFWAPIDALDLSMRLTNILKNENLLFAIDVVFFSKDELRKFPNIGRVGTKELVEALHARGLDVNMQIEGGFTERNKFVFLATLKQEKSAATAAHAAAQIEGAKKIITTLLPKTTAESILAQPTNVQLLHQYFVAKEELGTRGFKLAAMDFSEPHRSQLVDALAVLVPSTHGLGSK